MALFITISEGKVASEAKPIIAISDPRLVAALLKAIRKRGKR